MATRTLSVTWSLSHTDGRCPTPELADKILSTCSFPTTRGDTDGIGVPWLQSHTHSCTHLSHRCGPAGLCPLLLLSESLCGQTAGGSFEDQRRRGQEERLTSELSWARGSEVTAAPPTSRHYPPPPAPRRASLPSPPASLPSPLLLGPPYLPIFLSSLVPYPCISLHPHSSPPLHFSPPLSLSPSSFPPSHFSFLISPPFLSASPPPPPALLASPFLTHTSPHTLPLLS